METTQKQNNMPPKVLILFTVIILLSIIVYLTIKPNTQPETKEINKTDISKEAEIIAPKEAKEEVTVSSITGKSWAWQNTQLMNDTLVTAKDPNKFVLTFNKDNTFGTSTDCNRGFGKYSLDKSQLKFLEVRSTLMGCPESQEGIYFKDLQEVESYMIEGDKLILQLKLDVGYMTFKEVKE